jgi:predicted dehydrogenase
MECVHSGRKAEPGVEAAAQVQRVLEAAKLSEKEGRFVRVSSL